MPDRKLLAIALDSADTALVRDLIDRGEMPALARLEQEGCWGTIPGVPGGSTAAWPTFYTGEMVDAHNAHGTWQWDPATMRARPIDVSALTPFWAPGETDASFGLLDVPLAPMAGVERGFEIADWGAHASLFRRTLVAPAAVIEDVTETHA